MQSLDELSFIGLTRLQQRRVQGIPTLSVLVGTPAEATVIWQEWAASAGMLTSIQHPGQEVASFLEGSVLFVCEKIGEADLARLVERLCWLLVAPTDNAATLSLALAVDPAAAAAYLRDEPFSRARTLFAEGIVALPAGSTPTDGDTADPAGTPSVPLPTNVPLRTGTAASFAAAASALRLAAASSAEPAQSDRARSAAERFLFDLLHDLPDTTGLFELNVRLDFCFGPMRAEVDLLAAGLRLAVEIDGFHHFREPDAYRRDRRKDALLQRQGFLVLRFLAADVVERLEEILEEIRCTVAFRRATLPGA